MQSTKSSTNLLRRIFQQLRPYDRLTICYLSLVLVFILLSPHRPAAAALITAVHGAAILAVLFLPSLAGRFRFFQVLHDFYPMALFIVLFSEFTQLSTVLFPYWLEPMLIKFDFWAFGGSPLRWAASHISPAVAEFLAFAYWSYYLIVPGSLLLVYKKKYPRELIFATTRMCMTMYVCYVLFMLAPARGPHHTLTADGVFMMQGGFFTNLVRTIQSFGSVHGAAFPSSHVAVAWAMVFVLQRFYPKVALVAALLMAMLTLSVITMGYHFSLDAIGGVVVAFGINSAWRQENKQTNIDSR